MVGRELIARSAVIGGIGVLSVVVGGIGIATAANGGSLILGHDNSATATTTLRTSGGTPLALVGKASKPPLRVNSSRQVAHFNASLLGGLPASGVASGSGARTKTNTVGGVKVPLPFFTPRSSGVRIASTAKLAKGTYFVTASVMLTIGDTSSAICGLDVNGSPKAVQYGAAAAPEGNLTGASLVAPVTVKQGQKIGLYCFDEDTGTSPSLDVAYDGGIVAVHTATATTGTVVKPAAIGAGRQAGRRFGR